MKYKVLLLSKGMDLSESDLNKIKNKRIEDSVISSTDTIEVLTSDDGSEDIDVFVGIGDKAEEARCRAQKANKPSLLCDMDCSKADLKDIDVTIPIHGDCSAKITRTRKRLFLSISTCHLSMTMPKISWIILLRWYSTCLRSFLTIASIIQILDIRNKRSSSTNSPSSISTR